MNDSVDEPTEPNPVSEVSRVLTDLENTAANIWAAVREHLLGADPIEDPEAFRVRAVAALRSCLPAPTVAADELVGAHEVAARFGWTERNVHRLAHSDENFPEPIARLEAGKVWLLSEVMAWAKVTGRVPVYH